MGFFKDARQAMRNAREGTVDTSQLTPEQLAAYEANMARAMAAQAESQRIYEQEIERAQHHRVLFGPAGEKLYGPTTAPFSAPDQIQQLYAQGGPGSVFRQAMAYSAQMFGDAVKETIGKDLPPNVEDPNERARIEAAERAERDRARAPYRAPHLHPIGIARLATRGRSQIEEVASYLSSAGLAGRPDLVYGVYRVPDRISPPLTPQSEKGRVVEWDIVHAATGALAPSAPPEVVTFAAEEQWVARRVGEPSILDEDLGAFYCTSAGIGPELCIGIARAVRITAAQHEHAELRTKVDGVHVLHAPGRGGDGFVEQMASHAPLWLPIGPVPGVHVEVLDWDAISAVVHPARNRWWHLPSPFPYLPSTPQELLRMYLEVVGLLPSDSYSAQVTVDSASELVGRGPLGTTTNMGPDLPCADGKWRKRLHGAEQVVLAYRDRPEYVEGRERWAAYQRDVLQANLANGTNVRSAVPSPNEWDDIANPVLRAGVRVLSAVDRVTSWFDDDDEHLPPAYRYCWPPVR